MQDHAFVGDDRYCGAEIVTERRLTGGDVLVGWHGCGHEREVHPLGLEEAWDEAHREVPMTYVGPGWVVQAGWLGVAR